MPIKVGQGEEVSLNMTSLIDVVFFLDGSATWVVGGTPEGKMLAGGEPRAVAKDDVVIVPNKVQHWFSKVNGSVQYYAAKIITR